MLKSTIKLTGKLVIKKLNESNEVVYQTEVDNLVVTSGKEFVASRIANNDYSVMGYMAIGDDASNPALSQTSLVNELARVAVSGAPEINGSTVTFSATFGAGTGTGSIVEAGIFNTSSSSTIIFDGDNDVNASSDVITSIAHPFSTGDKVTYTDGGGTTIGNLIDGGTYYIIKLTNDTLKLASSYANALASIAIDITDGVGANHKLSKGIMLCRTKFPVIVKSGSETIAISWVVSVG